MCTRQNRISKTWYNCVHKIQTWNQCVCNQPWSFISKVCSKADNQRGQKSLSTMTKYEKCYILMLRNNSSSKQPNNKIYSDKILNKIYATYCSITYCLYIAPTNLTRGTYSKSITRKMWDQQLQGVQPQPGCQQQCRIRRSKIPSTTSRRVTIIFLMAQHP